MNNISKDNSPLLSVCMITYNHESFITQAIDGVLMQKTNFSFELIIGEDCSSDRTSQICKVYKEKYPDIIKLRLEEKNIGLMHNFIATLRSSVGKYIALCEGDDYWTDPYKLQKQVDFLEANQNYVLCTHKVAEIDEKNEITRFLEPEVIKDVYSYNDVNINITIWTCSVVYRNCVKEIPDWFHSLPAGDFPFWLLLTKYGKIKYMNDTMSVYRNNTLGIHSSLPRTKKIINGLILVKKMKNKFPRDYKAYFDDLRKKYLTLLSNEISTLACEEKYSYARKAIFLMIKQDITLENLRFPKFKIMVNILMGDKLWSLLMSLKGKRRLNGAN